MSCNSCGHSICSCHNTSYSSNWFSPESCNPCGGTEVCKQIVPAKCVIYKASNLANIGLTTNINVELILTTIDTSIGNIKNGGTLDKAAILTILNDINTRINTLAGGTPKPPYTL